MTREEARQLVLECLSDVAVAAKVKQNIRSWSLSEIGVLGPLSAAMFLIRGFERVLEEQKQHQLGESLIRLMGKE